MMDKIIFTSFKTTFQSRLEFQAKPGLFSSHWYDCCRDEKNWFDNFTMIKFACIAYLGGLA